MSYIKTLCKSISCLIATTLLLWGCHKEVYDSEAVKKDFFIQDIPAGFDWSTLSTVEVKVQPNDQYNGNYFYTIEIFNQNPLVTSQATLYAKGVCKESQPFQAKITLPYVQTSVFVRQTDPTGKKSIQMVAISGNKLECSFIPAPLALSEAFVQTRANTSKPQLDWEFPSNTIEITGNKTFTMTKNKTYVISNTFTGSVVFPPEGQGILYISGTWNNTASYTDMTQNSEIYVLDGGKVISNAAWNLSTNGVTIAIAKNGQWGQENNNINITFSNPSDLINEGRFYGNKIHSQTGNTHIFNDNELHVNELITENPNYIENNHLLIAQKINLKNPELVNEANATLTVKELIAGGGEITNKHKITAESIILNGTDVINECRIETENLKMSGNKYTQASHTSLWCEEMYADGATISLNSSSIFSVSDDLTFTSRLSKIEGSGKDFAVLKADEIKWASQGPHVKFSGNLEINCSDFEDNPQYNPYYSLKDAAYFAEGGSSVRIPASDCTGEGNNSEEGTPENPEFPFPETMTQQYTWITEDTYPNPGDYDMNDLVVGIDSLVNMINQDNQVESTALYMQIRAVGGTQQLGGAMQFEGLAPSGIASVSYSQNLKFTGKTFDVATNGTETGQTHAVVPLFDNAHQVLGLNNNQTIVNTISTGKPDAVSKDVQNIQVTVRFSQPLAKEVMAINKLNFFAVVENNTGLRNIEIHLPEFKHTDKSSTPAGTQQTTKGLMWGLLLPCRFQYAEERTDIRQAYPQFQEWVTSNKVSYPEWYNHPDEQNVYKQ